MTPCLGSPEMKARVYLSFLDYEVNFARPAFSCIGSFARIIEPIHDALSQEQHVPPDAIRFENGDSIATSSISGALHLGRSVFEFEARLDGYKARSRDLWAREDVDRARRYAKLFEAAVTGVMADGVPASWRLAIPSWWILDGGVGAAEDLVRKLTWRHGSDDPFEIGAIETRSRVAFECFSPNGGWVVNVALEKAAPSDANLFLEVSGVYAPGSMFDSFDKKTDHLFDVSRTIVDQLGLLVEQ